MTLKNVLFLFKSKKYIILLSFTYDCELWGYTVFKSKITGCVASNGFCVGSMNLEKKCFFCWNTGQKLYFLYYFCKTNQKF